VTGCHKCSRPSSDTYDIYYANPGLLPALHADPAEYPPGETWTLDEDHGDATVEDICDFIVEYIHSDVMVCSVSCSKFSVHIFVYPQGLLADRHIVIADQSKVRPYSPINYRDLTHR
jgi:RNA-dependent RNA polymerase